MLGKTINLAVLGVVSAALMLVARVGLTHLGLPHYTGVELSGHEGLKSLGLCLAYGALFAIVYGFLVRPILPSGLLMGGLVFSILPFVAFAMGLPMWRGEAMVSDTWTLVYIALHWYLFSLALVLLGGSRGGGGKASKE
jgi:hypothetical protein